ncbi:DUF2306 domain-containing protein [Saccharothrix algeriensis]|uniref:DUF2306 domain-containing protein n=1 Tax=Saccharothrix algeriensis TaxID=173560 RepID=A0A8T8I3Q0_9PSEU|nr:DUF2306 domain-containing protein [Saccharothrix algeriensis]MBM7811623.1 uncharacterized membrane protein YozB (DUF420 family) [Saccharothrix algeriensis]QTR05412.1 DUF2306 domain-containing protein [Saccharothrix algeriensis]
MVETQVRVSWWRRPWVLPLGVLVLAFVAFSLPPYLTLDSAQSRVPQPAGHAWHYPVLAAHVVFGSIAMLTCVLQIWPAFRRKHPHWHRRAGRVYVFGGVLPGGVLAVAVGAVSPFGPALQFSNVLMGLLWLAFTVAGYRAGRRKRYAEHRRWMLRSSALTLSVITNRFWAVGLGLTLPAQLDTTFGGSEVALTQTVAGTSAWMGWVVPLLLVEWWLERGDARKRRTRRAQRQVDRTEVGV